MEDGSTDEHGIPDYQTMSWNVLKAFEDGGVHTPEEVRESVQRQLGVSDDQAAVRIKSGATVLANRVAWAMTRLDAAKLTTRVARGQRQITARGKELLKGEPVRLTQQLLADRYPEFSKTLHRWRSGPRHVDSPKPSSAVRSDDERTPEEKLRDALESAHSALRDELLDKLVSAPWMFFESVVLDVLAALGYGGGKREWAERTGQPGDGGVDGIIREDALGLEMIYVQAKRYTPDNSIGRPALQQFAGTLDMRHAKKGVFITTSSFADTAVQYARQIEKRIALIDGDELVDHMIENNIGVRPVENFTLKAIDENYFDQ